MCVLLVCLQLTVSSKRVWVGSREGDLFLAVVPSAALWSDELREHRQT